MELLITGHALRWARQSRLTGGFSLCEKTHPRMNNKNLKNTVTNEPRIGKFGQEDRKRKLKGNMMDGVKSGGLEGYKVDEKEAAAECRITPVDVRWIGTDLFAETTPLESLMKGVEELEAVGRVKFADMREYRQIVSEGDTENAMMLLCGTTRTIGDDFVFAETTKTLIEFERKMTKVQSIEARVIGHGSFEEHKKLNRRLREREQGVVCQHNPRRIDMIVKDFRLELGNYAQTSSEFDVNRRGRVRNIGSKSISPIQVERRQTPDSQ